jgi:hypothetical protein
MVYAVMLREEQVKKLPIIFVLFVLISGCASITVSSIYDTARPNHIVLNEDGSTTFEFLFPAEDYDGTAALERIHEFLGKYSAENGFMGYDVLNTNGATLEKTHRYFRLIVGARFKVAR